ncbi:uncharacterized protein RHOBADRAFT_53282, partial [Rhodotorula graminis WP1]
GCSPAEPPGGPRRPLSRQVRRPRQPVRPEPVRGRPRPARHVRPAGLLLAACTRRRREPDALPVPEPVPGDRVPVLDGRVQPLAGLCGVPARGAVPVDPVDRLGCQLHHEQHQRRPGVPVRVPGRRRDPAVGLAEQRQRSALGRPDLPQRLRQPADVLVLVVDDVSASNRHVRLHRVVGQADGHERACGRHLGRAGRAQHGQVGHGCAPRRPDPCRRHHARRRRCVRLPAQKAAPVPRSRAQARLVGRAARARRPPPVRRLGRHLVDCRLQQQHGRRRRRRRQRLHEAEGLRRVGLCGPAGSSATVVDGAQLHDQLGVDGRACRRVRRPPRLPRVDPVLGVDRVRHAHALERVQLRPERRLVPRPRRRVACRHDGAPPPRRRRRVDLAIRRHPPSCPLPHHDARQHPLGAARPGVVIVGLRALVLDLFAQREHDALVDRRRRRRRRRWAGGRVVAHDARARRGVVAHDGELAGRAAEQQWGDVWRGARGRRGRRRRRGLERAGLAKAVV